MVAEDFMPPLRNKSRVLSAATLSGYLVRTGENEDLGAVEELMIDPETRAKPSTLPSTISNRVVGLVTIV